MKWIITGMVLGMLCVLCVLIIYIYYLVKTKHSKVDKVKLIGMTAEKNINADLKKWAKKNNSIFINSNLYHYDNNKVFEVDAILLTVGGIIVIEIKSINGVIIGSGNDLKWTKKLKHSSYDITNPLKQNDRHIQHIIKIINEKVPIVSLIIFSNRAEDLQISDVPEYALVIRHSSLFEKLDKINIVLKPALTNKDLKNIKKTISKYIANNKYSKNLHKRITGRIK